GALFRSGVLLNSGEAIERLAAVDTILFDKTGTLTLPEPEVVNAADIPPDAFALAGPLALASPPPLSAATARAPNAKVRLSAIEEPAEGVRSEANGAELRLGRPSFCGADRGGGHRRRPRGICHRVPARRASACVRGASAVAQRCSRHHR